MYYLLLIMPVMISASNISDVFVSYSGHSEVDRKVPETTKAPECTTEGDIVFVPNDTPVRRNEETFYERVNEQTERIEDVTESPKDTLFISGKNNENIERTIKTENKERQGDVMTRGQSHGEAPKKGRKKLDCNNIICNNTKNSLCGSRDENGKVKFRLFLNECYLRKVNCGFRNEISRYSLVSMAHCRGIAAHGSRPEVYQPLPPSSDRKVNNTRRTFVSRRSLTKGIDGGTCDHACPVTCTDDYDPECAMSSARQRKVFLNHCKLDLHSCALQMVWYRRPLSECVGGKKADVQQNRGFIGWMQRVGIVDKKGRLVLS